MVIISRTGTPVLIGFGFEAAGLVLFGLEGVDATLEEADAAGFRLGVAGLAVGLVVGFDGGDGDFVDDGGACDGDFLDGGSEFAGDSACVTGESGGESTGEDDSVFVGDVAVEAPS